MYTSRALNKWTKQGVHTPLLNVQSPLSPEQARSPCFCCTDCWHLSLHGRKQLSLRASCFEGSASIKLSSLFPVCKHHDNHLRFNTCLWCSSVMLISLSLLPLQPPPTLPCLFLSVCLSACVCVCGWMTKAFVVPKPRSRGLASSSWRCGRVVCPARLWRATAMDALSISPLPSPRTPKPCLQAEADRHSYITDGKTTQEVVS